MYEYISVSRISTVCVALRFHMKKLEFIFLRIIYLCLSGCSTVYVLLFLLLLSLAVVIIILIISNVFIILYYHHSILSVTI